MLIKLNKISKCFSRKYMVLLKRLSLGIKNLKFKRVLSSALVKNSYHSQQELLNWASANKTRDWKRRSFIICRLNLIITWNLFSRMLILKIIWRLSRIFIYALLVLQLQKWWYQLICYPYPNSFHWFHQEQTWIRPDQINQ